MLEEDHLIDRATTNGPLKRTEETVVNLKRYTKSIPDE